MHECVGTPSQTRAGVQKSAINLSHSPEGVCSPQRAEEGAR